MTDLSSTLPASSLAGLMRELRQMAQQPIEGIQLQMNDNLMNLHAQIEGPVSTPFEGGLFKIKLTLSSQYPHTPPKAYFMTKIFHPNVNATSGEICVNTLKKDWQPQNGLRHVLVVIRCLLIVPNPESALNEDAGKMLIDAYSEYAKRAQLMTRIHAKPKGSAVNAQATQATATASQATIANQHKKHKPTPLQPAAVTLAAPTDSPVNGSKENAQQPQQSTSLADQQSTGKALRPSSPNALQQQQHAIDEKSINKSLLDAPLSASTATDENARAGQAANNERKSISAAAAAAHDPATVVKPVPVSSALDKVDKKAAAKKKSLRRL